MMGKKNSKLCMKNYYLDQSFSFSFPHNLFIACWKHNLWKVSQRKKGRRWNDGALGKNMKNANSSKPFFSRHHHQGWNYSQNSLMFVLLFTFIVLFLFIAKVCFFWPIFQNWWYFLCHFLIKKLIPWA